LDPIGVCAKCFGPLDPVYDRDEQRRTISRESIADGPASIWRYAGLLPVAPPAEARLPAGWTPLVRVPRLEQELGLGELWLSSTGRRARSRSRRRRRRRGAQGRPHDDRVLVDRQSRECRRRTRPETRAVVLVHRSRAGEADRNRDLRGEDLRRQGGPTTARGSSRAVVRLDWAFVGVGLRAYYAEGSRPLGFEIAGQLGWGCRMQSWHRSRQVRVLEGHQGWVSCFGSGLVGGASRVSSAAGRGCSPVATAFASGEEGKPLRPNDRQVACDQGVRRRRDRDAAPARRGAVRHPRGRDRGEHRAARQTTSVFGGQRQRSLSGAA
jgi:threonine synthase